MSSAIFNVTATTFVNQPVTISLSGLIKGDSTVKVVAGDASAYQQNVTYIPPLDFIGTGVVNCEVSDGNKVSISIDVLRKPEGAFPTTTTNNIRRQVRQTTMAGDPVEERFWEVVEDSGKIEGPAAAYVPLQIQKVTALEYIEEHPPEACLEQWPSTNYFSTPGGWIQFDLGQICNISEINIHWHGICNFSLAISNDRKSFVNVYQGRGVGVSNINMPKAAAVLFKITAMDNLMEIAYVSVKGSPITPKATQTGAQAILKHSSQMVEPGHLVVMDGSQSRGDILRFVWENPNSNPSVILFNDKTSIASFIAPDVEQPTTLQFSMTVVDRNGQYSKAISLIHITPKKEVKRIGEKLVPPELSDDELKKASAALDDFYREHPSAPRPPSSQ